MSRRCPPEQFAALEAPRRAMRSATQRFLSVKSPSRECCSVPRTLCGAEPGFRVDGRESSCLVWIVRKYAKGRGSPAIEQPSPAGSFAGSLESDADSLGIFAR
jgi:hypothetical protein